MVFACFPQNRIESILKNAKSMSKMACLIADVGTKSANRGSTSPYIISIGLTLKIRIVIALHTHAAIQFQSIAFIIFSLDIPGERAESEEGVDSMDIDVIMKQLSVDRNTAVKALKNTGDVVDAIFEISNK